MCGNRTYVYEYVCIQLSVLYRLKRSRIVFTRLNNLSQYNEYGQV